MCCGRDWIAPREGRIPVNVPALAWSPGPGQEAWCPARFGQAQEIRLLRLGADGGDVAVPFAFTPVVYGNLLRPMEPLVVGASYRLVAHNRCPGHVYHPAVDETHQAAFEVGPAMPLPTTLGVIVGPSPVRRTLQVAANGGPCSIYPDVSAAEISVRLSPEAEPWAPLFFYETLVDGQPWTHRNYLCDIPPHGRSIHGRGRDLVYAVCATNTSTALERPSITPGRHTLRFRATLPGVDAPLLSEAYEVNFDCSPTQPDAGAMDAAVTDAGTPDAGVADVGTPDTGIADLGVADTGVADTGVADAGVADAGVADAGVADAGEPPTGRLVRACACRGAPGVSARSVPWMLALAVALPLRRRRRATPAARA